MIRSHASKKTLAIILSLVCLLMTSLAMAVTAYAEYTTVNLWYGLTGDGNTYGSPGDCYQNGGVAYSYADSSQSIYYLYDDSREWSTAGGVHLINEQLKNVFNTNFVGTVQVPWPGCSWNYVTTRHYWQGAPAPTDKRVNAYTSATGSASSQACWLGANCY